MCGIVGIVGLLPDWRNHIGRACDVLHHRGPDDRGIWFDESAGVALGHARLSILDLSATGHQPMASANGRYVVVFNGEIYNHLDLREQLEKVDAHRWRGHSDTETLLACIVAWGPEATLRAAVGMFALGVWDRREGKLLLARDRMGEKPLYYGYVGRAFAFASELKSLAALPGFSMPIDRGALALFMRHNYIPAPRTIYRGIAKLPPGSWLEVSSKAAAMRDAPAPRPYWSAIEQAIEGARSPRTFESDTDAVNTLDTLLRRAIAGQMVADVPLGAFLSGGIDSSTVVSLMQAQSPRPVRTFSIGFPVWGYDEAPHAKAVAQHLGTEHNELYVSAADALAVIPRLASIYDEPFADSSQIPTYLVARLAREHVKVCLSGDGGDELFGGYNRYFLGARMWGLLRRIPRATRRVAARLILAKSPMFWDAFYRLMAPIIPKRLALVSPGDQLHKGARLIEADSGMTLYRQLVSHWEPGELVLHEREPESPLSEPPLALRGLTEMMMAFDALTYLPDDILVKVDRAAMAVSLETRVPMLDHRIFEFAWRLPMHYKVRNGVGKWLLRQVLERYVPARFMDRPKAGFAVPIDSWLRGPLRPWAEALLSESRLRSEGYLNPAPIRQKWAEHLAGRHNWQHYLWSVLIFQAWLEHEGQRRYRT
jgi:asparagine synthase (glutamine-hydrolysing)